MALDYEALLRPISASAPSGEDFDDGESDLMAPFTAMQAFGQPRPLGETLPPTETEPGGRTSGPQFSWRDVLGESERALAKTKDIRILAHAGAALLRLEGLEDFTRTLEVAADWLKEFWDSVHPRLGDEPIARANALYAFADRMAILDGLRRTPLAAHRQLGTCTFRDLEPRAAADGEAGAAAAAAILEASELESLLALEAVIDRALAAARQIEAQMRAATENEAVPDLGGLTGLLARIRTAVEKYAAPKRAAAGLVTSPAGADGSVAEGSPAAGAGGAPVGSIQTRQDAIRALDAVAEFFRRTEPSSPVPLFVERSKRLISMSFIELLNEVAPSGVAEAKGAAGLPSNG